MQWQQVVHGLITVLAPIMLARGVHKRQLHWLLGVLISVSASAALTFAAWMLMRIYIGRRGGSLGILFNAEISMPWWIASALIAAVSYGVITVLRRRSSCTG